MSSSIHGSTSGRAWWQKPGLGVMYQIEFRPGWRWQRNWNKFNASMKDEHGRFNFNGPYCRIDEWIELSREIGVDYHIFEVKWHDGICWFNTSLTDWKTPTDYASQFVEGSRKAGIPFMFYYSSIIDHNPKFQSIIPMNSITSSFPRMRGSEYGKYLEGQMREIIDQYDPDGLWLDWYTMGVHPSENVVMDFLHDYSPKTVVTFNNTNFHLEERLRFPREKSGRIFLEILRTLVHIISIPHPQRVTLWTAALFAAWLHQKIFDPRAQRRGGNDVIDLIHYSTSEAHTLKEAWKESNPGG